MSTLCPSIARAESGIEAAGEPQQVAKYRNELSRILQAIQQHIPMIDI